MLTGADDQIALPVAEALALVDEGWPFVDGDLVRDSAPALLATPIAFPTGLLATQGEVQAASFVENPPLATLGRYGKLYK